MEAMRRSTRLCNRFHYWRANHERPGFFLPAFGRHSAPPIPQSTAILGQIVSNANIPLDFRKAAAHALASIHTSATLPYLSMLLQDSRPALRAEAIGGLSAFANGSAAQTPANTATLKYLQIPKSAQYQTSDTLANGARGEQAISQNEPKYLSSWTTWWQQHRAELGY